ncbi:MAG: phosphate ABC transporter permease, partial [Pseudomonadota bacterium]
MFKDSVASRGVAIGGVGVIIAIVLIFFYLLYVVFPLFLPAEADGQSRYSLPGKTQGETLHLALEEQNEIGVRFTDRGRAVFFHAKSGKVVADEAVNLPTGVAVSSFAVGNPARGVVAYGLADGRAIVVRHAYRLSYPDDVR